MSKWNNRTEEFCYATGYQAITDYWEKFVEKEQEGLDELKSFLKEEFEARKNSDLTQEENYKRITEFVMIMNWRSRYLDNNGMQGDIEDVYIKLWIKYNDWCHAHLKGEAGRYYFKTTD